MLLLGLGISAAWAVEGMWEPSQVPTQATGLAAAGFKGDVGALGRLDVAPLGAVASLGGFCTASFVSAEGLLVTNHHCVTGLLQQAQAEGEDLIDTGFVARTRGEERSVGPGGRVYLTTDIRDVTDDVLGKLPKKLGDAARDEAIEARMKQAVARCEKPGVRCRVASFYGGANYRLVTQTEFQDVRVVMAPPDSVGNYGDEIDNWHWPRHAGDFGFLRVYVGKDGKSAPYAPDNVPYRPAHHLTVQPKGVGPGDFVMVAGYPGSTDRWRTALEVERAATVELPNDIAEEQFLLDTFAEVAKADPAAGPVLEPARLSIANGMFNAKGTLEGYARTGIVAQAKARDAALRAWVAADPARKERFGAALDELDTVLRSGDATRERDELLAYLRYGSDLLEAAETVVLRARERTKKDADRLPGFQERDEARTRARFASMQKGLQLTADRRILGHYLGRLAVRSDCPPELRAWLGLPTTGEVAADAGAKAVDAAMIRLYGAAGKNDSGGGVAEGTLPPLAPASGPKAASVGRERSPEGDAAPGAASDRPRPRRSSGEDDREGAGAPSAPTPNLYRLDYRTQLLDLAADKLPADDAWISLAMALRPVRDAQRAEGRARGGALARLRPLYVEAMKAHDPARAYSDANSTLRLTYGTVQGYTPRDAVTYAPQTTLEGIAEKAGAWPFDAAPAHLAAITAKQYGPYVDTKLGSVPVDFLSDLDITGGNSGSPTLNAAGELVGLAFDGNYEGIASDWVFDTKVARTIHVDARYVLWYLDAVAQADGLVTELGQTPSL